MKHGTVPISEPEPFRRSCEFESKVPACGEVKDAMNALKKKLKSERGASITWALLIFLVCTVVGSAVLVAGTAASGRMSKITENDQRYYAVSSAARLLMDKLDGQTVTITKQSGANPVYADGEGNALSPDKSIPLNAACYLDSSSSTTTPLTITVAPSSTDTDKKGLTVSVEERFDNNGSMTLTVTGTGTDSAVSTETPNSYNLKLYFNLDRDVLKDTENGDIYSYTWHLRNIEVVGSQRWNNAVQTNP